MCSLLTLRFPVEGSAKGQRGWVTASRVTVSYDHPVHAPFEEALNVDVLSDVAGPSARVTLELTPSSARQLAEAILAALAAGEAGLSIRPGGPGLYAVTPVAASAGV